MALLDVPGLPPLRADASGPGVRHGAVASAEAVSDVAHSAVTAEATTPTPDARSPEADRKAAPAPNSTHSSVSPP